MRLDRATAGASIFSRRISEPQTSIARLSCDTPASRDAAADDYDCSALNVHDAGASASGRRLAASVCVGSLRSANAQRTPDRWHAFGRFESASTAMSRRILRGRSRALRDVTYLLARTMPRRRPANSTNEVWNAPYALNLSHVRMASDSGREVFALSTKREESFAKGPPQHLPISQHTLEGRSFL